MIHSDVLPEVRQLQRGAGVVGELLPFRVAVTAQVEHKVTDRICRVLAISQQVVEARIAGDDLVLTKRCQQVGKLMLRDIEFPHRLAQRDKHGMARLAGIALPQLGLPLVQQRQRLLLVADLVAQIVGDAAVGIDVVEVLVQMLGQKPRDDREIFVMRMASRAQYCCASTSEGACSGMAYSGGSAFQPLAAASSGAAAAGCDAYTRLSIGAEDMS